MSAPEHTRPATPPDRAPSDQTDPDAVQPRAAQPDAAAPDDARPEPPDPTTDPTRPDPTRTEPTRTEPADEVAPAVGLAAGGTSTGRAGGPAPTLPRLRRPSGYPPPLPHHWRRRNVALLLGLAVWVVVWSSAYLAGQVSVRRAEAAAVDFLARDHRSDLTVALARAVDFVDRPLLLNCLVLVTIAGAAALGRFRRAFVQLGAILLALYLVSLLAVAFDRPRPYDAEILGRWAGYGVALDLHDLPGRHRRRRGLLLPAPGPGAACRVRGRRRPGAADGGGEGRARGQLATGGPGRRRDRRARVRRRVHLLRPGRGLPARPARLPLRPPRPRRPPARHRAGAGLPARRPAAGAEAVRAGRVRRVQPDAAAGGGRAAAAAAVREALRTPARPGRPVVQARPRDALRPAGGRAPVPHRPPDGAERGLPAAGDAGRRTAGGPLVRLRGADPGPRVHAGHRVRRRGEGDLRRRRDDGARAGRRRPAGGPRDVGGRRRAPGREAVQPARSRRQAGAHRRRLRRGAPEPVAAGGGPGEHDAGAGAEVGLRDGLPAGAALLQPGRPGRGIRRHRRGDRAVAVEDVAGGRRPRPAGPLPGAGPAAAAGEGAEVEPAPDGVAGRLGGGGRRRHPAGGPGGAVHRSGRGAGRGLPDQHAGAAVRPGGPGRRVRALRSAGVRARTCSPSPPPLPGCAMATPGPRRSCPTTAR